MYSDSKKLTGLKPKTNIFGDDEDNEVIKTT